MKLLPFVGAGCVSWIVFPPMGWLPAQEAAPAPKEEWEQLEARLKELGRSAEVDPLLVPLKVAFTEADQKLQSTLGMGPSPDRVRFSLAPPCSGG